MPHSPKREKDLLGAVKKEKMGLIESMIYFSRSKSNPDIKASALGLRRLESHELIKFRNISTKEIVWFEDEMLQQPEEYEIFFNGYGFSEIEMSEVNESVLSSEVHEITKYRFQVAVESKSLLSIDGELDEATILLERARAFTQQFAYYLITRNYSAVVYMFSEYLRTQITASQIRSEIEKREKTYGDFELFDHIVVENIYNGPSGWKATMDADWWPKETDKKTRRAVSTFQLGSFVSPGGVILEGCYMSISIIEEDSLFRVQKYRLYTGN